MARPAGAERAAYGALLDALRGLTWPARAPVRGGSSGTHRSRLRGVSPEFTEYRPYRQGDDTRRLDWRLLARTDRAFLRVTSERATLGTLFAVDASASMAYPADHRSKWEYARALTVGLTAVVHASGDPAGLVVAVGAAVRRLPLRTRRGVVSDAVRTLASVEPHGSAPLAPALGLVAQARRLVLVSDWLGDTDDVVRFIRTRIARGVEAHAVHIVARDELSPPDTPFLARDPEHPEIERPLAEATHASYVREFARWRDELGASWRSAGAAYTVVATDEPLDLAVRRIVRPGASARVVTW